jgi:hypothetical protein
LTEHTLSHPAQAACVSELSFDQAVPRGLAHRTALSEVYVADSVRHTDTEFFCAVQVPRSHIVWWDRRVAFHDPLAMVEATRQATLVVFHRHLGVPFGAPFSVRRLAFRVDDLPAFKDDERTPLDGVLRWRIVDQQRQGSRLGSMSMVGDLAINGTVALTVEPDFVFLPRDDYDALREFQRARIPAGTAPPAPPRPIDPALVGRRDERNVVIGEIGDVPAAGPAGADATGDGGPGDGGSPGTAPVGTPDTTARYHLISDRRHPAFFDHPYDHVPGPLMLEAFQQAAVATATRAGVLPSPPAAVVDCDVTFSNFGEFDAPIEVVATVDPAAEADAHAGVRLELRQFDKSIAAARLRLSPYPPD